MPEFKKVAVFGSGQVSRSIVNALAQCHKQEFHVIQVLPPWHQPPDGQNENSINSSDSRKVETYYLDVTRASQAELVPLLTGVDAVVSTLEGAALRAQRAIQDAAAVTGVKRFYPSEFGMHHIYNKPGDDLGYLHPIWNHKRLANESVVKHPAILSGAMTYTLIGCGELYNQDREPVWCPWTRTDVPIFEFPVVGGIKHAVDFTHTDDLAAFVVETLCSERSGLANNAMLNFVSDRISYDTIARLLERYARKPVRFVHFPEEEWHRMMENPAVVPEWHKTWLSRTAFPLDFRLLVRGIQGQGRFTYAPGQVHNHLFPDVKVTTFEKYLSQKFASEDSRMR